jgi:uncharacterized protein
MKRPWACAAAAGWLALPAAAAVSVPPRPDRYATDRAGVTDAARLAALNERLAQFERETSNQVLVYVDRRVPAGTTLEEFATAALGAWGVGQKGKDNGVVFFAFIDDRKMRIEVGYGLEGAVPDARANRIIEEQVKPRFRSGDFTGGVEQAAVELMKAARGEPYQGTGSTAAESLPTGPLPMWLWGIPLVAMAGGWLAQRGAQTGTARLARGGGTWAGVTAFLSMVASPIANDVRPMVIGFGVLMVGASVAVALIIGQVGQNATLSGRRRFGLVLVQAGAALLLGTFALMLLAVAWGSLANLAGLAFLLGPPTLILGGLLRSEDPLRVLTVFFARAACIVFLISAGLLTLILVVGASGAQAATDWTVVSGLVWIALWVFARSRGWKLIEKIQLPSGGGWSYSSGGRSSGGWSSGSSSWSSSSRSSGSSFSGGGGRSGGGGSSGSW